jgi:nucleotide-binding universal stress UspA family protein
MKLLCATDLQDKSEVAVERAYQLRESAGAALKLVHVVSPLGADEGTLEQRLLSASSRLAMRARHAGAVAELVVRCGRPATVVSEEASASEFIVIGAHDSDGVRDTLRGTFVENLLTHSRRPILIARRPASEPYRRILLALDGSRATGQVVRVAERLPVAPDAEFAAVHAHEPPYEAMMNTVGVGNLSVASYAAASMSQAATMIHSRLRMHSVDWRRYRVMLMDSRPGPAIRHAMSETRPDLLVLGTRGHGRFRRAMLGSTAHEFLATADCDVLVVPDTPGRSAPPDQDSGPRAA